MRRHAAPSVALSILALASASSAVAQENQLRTGGGFEVRDRVLVDALPLRSQTTTVDVVGVVARIQLTQVWENDGGTPLEATYVFPVSTRIAVHDLRLRIGDGRELRAELRAKEQAEKIFDDARAAGRTAGLLGQQRPNVVTLHVTNIMPGDRITVTVEATELVRPVAGVYELVLPQTIGARYHGGAGGEELVENGHIESAASQLRTNIDVTLRSPIGIRGVGSPSHGIAPRFRDAGEAAVAVASSETDVVADRDLVLRWRLASEKIETGVMLFRDRQRDEHFFLLLGEAPPVVRADEAPPREVVFVVDVSGSMDGFPLATAKDLVRDLVRELRPVDSFNMVFFAGSDHVLAPTGSLAATAANIARATTALDERRGGGGTELGRALDTALALPSVRDGSAPRARTVVVVTDGLVSAERAVFDRVRDARGDAKVFAFGVGGSVNRDLIEKLGVAGGTESFVVVDAEQSGRAVERFRAAARPALTHVALRFEGFTPVDVEPARLPDLHPGVPLVVLGRFTGPSTGRVVVTGDGLGGARYERSIEIEDHLERASHAPLRELWARERIARIADRGTPSAADLAEVERLGLQYRVLTERTSFVVVDPAARNARGALAAVAQPMLRPRGTVSAYGAPGVGAGGNGSFGSALGGLKGASASLSHGGNGNIELGGRGKGATRVGPGKIAYKGGLSRDEIQRVVGRVMSQAKYCYEKELVRDPTLVGKVVASWTIDATGKATHVAIAANTIAGASGAAVGGCVARIVARLVFPAPRGGGEVHVTYPFVFSSGA